MQQSHSREHEHPKPDFALIGDTHLFRTIKTVVASTQLLTIVGMLATVGTSQNCHQKKRVLSHRTVMNSFPSEKTKKNWQKLGEQNSFYERKFATEYTYLCKTFAEIRKRKDYYSY